MMNARTASTEYGDEPGKRGVANSSFIIQHSSFERNYGHQDLQALHGDPAVPNGADLRGNHYVRAAQAAARAEDPDLWPQQSGPDNHLASWRRPPAPLSDH